MSTAATRTVSKDVESPKTPSPNADPPNDANSIKEAGCLPWLKRNLLAILTIISVFLGIAAGFVLRYYDIVEPSDKETIRLIAFPGVIFLQMMKLTVLPLIITSLIAGLGSLGGKNTGRMMTITFTLFGVTACLAAYTGVALALIVHPGKHTFHDESLSNVSTISTIDTMMDLLRNIFPDNVIKAFTKSQQSLYEKETLFNETLNSTITKDVLTTKYVDGTNALGIVALSVAIGLCLSKLGEKGKAVLDVFLVLEKIITQLVLLVMWASPVGIISFIIEQVVESEDLIGLLKSVGWYIATVFVACAIQMFITLPLVAFVLTRRNPYSVLKAVLPAIATAIALNSSGPALPFNYECCEKNLKIPRKVTRFVLSIGVSLNMSGSAAYMGVSSIFIAQLNGIELSWAQIVLIGLISILAAASCTVGPSADVVALIIVLTSIGIPLNQVSLMLALDWIVGRADCPVNVVGDSFAAFIVSHFMKDEEQEENDVEKGDKNDAGEE